MILNIKFNQSKMSTNLSENFIGGGIIGFIAFMTIRLFNFHIFGYIILSMFISMGFACMKGETNQMKIKILTSIFTSSFVFVILWNS